MPVQINPAFFVGLVLFFVGFAIVFVSMARHGGLAFGFKSWTNMAAFLRDPKQRGSRRIFWIAVVVMVFGGLISCGSIMAGDAARNRRCRDACEAAGFETGRFRHDPHVRAGPDPAATYQCWCRRGARWSDEPVAMPPERERAEP